MRVAYLCKVFLYPFASPLRVRRKFYSLWIEDVQWCWRDEAIRVALRQNLSLVADYWSNLLRRGLETRSEYCRSP